MKVYVASKVNYAPMWKELRAKWAPSVNISSRWINEQGVEDDSKFTPTYFGEAWARNTEDIKWADKLICFAKEGETLRGALVEIGCALSWENPVAIVGYCGDVFSTHGSWQFHPLVTRLPDFDAAYEWARNSLK